MEFNDYNKLKLSALREIARSLKVKAPTSLTKADLINKIIRIERGEEEPYTSTKGRPPLNTTSQITNDKSDLLLEAKLNAVFEEHLENIVEEERQFFYKLIELLKKS